MTTQPEPAGRNKDQGPSRLASFAGSLQRPLSALAMGLFPGRCAACEAALPWRRHDEALCLPCAEILAHNDGPACAICGEAFASARAVTHVCGRCSERRPPYALLRSPWIYAGPARDAILRFKLNDRPYLFRPLSRPMAGLVDEAGWSPDLVTSVPMSRAGLRRRGYDPAHLLALGLCGHLGWPKPQAGLLAKTRETPSQRGASAAARRDNVRDAFTAGRRAARQLSGREVLLVDDVVTTGATADACARVLKRAGAQGVTVVTLARTPYD